MRRRWQRSRDRMDFIRYGLLMAALALGLWWADSQMRPAIRTMAAYQAKVYATEAINRAVADYMTEWEAAGGQAVTVTYGERGEVAMVQADMAALNALRTAITAEVTEEIARLEEQDIKIPIGTFLGGQIFSGRGPKIVFKVVPTGYVNADIENRFDTAGINQTRHQIYVEVSASIAAILPGYISPAEVSTRICVAETVIVGAVPELYLGQGGLSGFLP